MALVTGMTAAKILELFTGKASVTHAATHAAAGSDPVLVSSAQIAVNDAGDTITVASTAVLPTRQVNAGTGLTGGGDLSANRTLSVSYGTTAGTSAQGNDSRFGKIGGTVSVSGTPTAGQVPIASSDTNAAWGTPSGGGGGLAWSGVNVGSHLPVWASGGHSGFSLNVGRMIPCPLVAVEAMNVDAVSIYVDTGVATSTIDLAAGAIGSFVKHLATIDTSSAGLKTATFAPSALAAGIHVVMARANTAGVPLWGVSNSRGICRMNGPGGGNNQYAFPHATWAGSAPSWPSSPTWDWNAGVHSSDGTVPKLQLRRST